MIRKAAVLLVAVLTIAIPSGIASAAAHGTNRPFHATDVLTGPFTFPGTFDVSGPFRGTHIGNGTDTATLNEADPTFSFPSTITAANGDQIFTLAVHPAAPDPSVSCPSDYVGFRDPGAITGGTGRFGGATGSLVFTTCATIDANGNLILIQDIVGTISY